MFSILRIAIVFMMLGYICPVTMSFAGGASPENCAGKTVELKCYNRDTGQWCGTMGGTSCYNEAQDICAAESASAPCSAECQMRKECDRAFPACCKGNCALYYKFTKGLTDYWGECPAGFRP